MSTTIYPQFSHSIDNSKHTDLMYNESNEILCINYFKDYKEENNDGYLIVGGNFNKIQVYKFKTGERFSEMDGHMDSVTCFAQDGYFLMSGSDDMSIIVWNTNEWYSDKSEQVNIIRPHRVLGDEETGHT